MQKVVAGFASLSCSRCLDWSTQLSCWWSHGSKEDAREDQVAFLLAQAEEGCGAVV